MQTNKLKQLTIQSELSEAILRRQELCQHPNMQIVEIFDHERDESISVCYCPDCQYEE